MRSLATAHDRTHNQLDELFQSLWVTLFIWAESRDHQKEWYEGIREQVKEQLQIIQNAVFFAPRLSKHDVDYLRSLVERPVSPSHFFLHVCPEIKKHILQVATYQKSCEAAKIANRNRETLARLEELLVQKLGHIMLQPTPRK